MILKMFKAVWFLSVLAVLANLIYVYASLPEDVIIQEESAGSILAGKEFLFYLMTAFIVLVNVLVYVVGKLFSREELFKAWFHGLIVTINIFFIFAMTLVMVYNSSEKFDFESIGYMIYSSVALVILWAACWPLYTVFRKFYPKQAVL